MKHQLKGAWVLISGENVGWPVDRSAKGDSLRAAIKAVESYPETLRGADIPLYISREKADAYRDMMHPDELMITADTIVWLDGQVLGKPKNREEAMQMLRDMSGRTHEVFTGVCITTTEWQRLSLIHILRILFYGI